MRLWAEERKRGGTIELLLTLPVPHLGGRLSASSSPRGRSAGIALALTFPLWITVNCARRPRQRRDRRRYLGSLLMAGGFLAIGACTISAMTKSQVIAFVCTAVACFLLLLTGFPLVQDFFAGWAPGWLTETVAGLSVLTRFDSISKGVVALRDLLYFVSLIAVALAATGIVIDLKKAE
jgi:ABC-2 type transport system permease protein